jgi:hypothetical protein
MLFQLGDQWSDFLGDEFFGGLADQPLVVRQFRGGENVFRARGFQKKTAA